MLADNIEEILTFPNLHPDTISDLRSTLAKLKSANGGQYAQADRSTLAERNRRAQGGY